MGLLSGLASIANSVVSPIANKRSAEREYKRNRSLMQEQYQLQAQENQLAREWNSAENEKAYQRNIEQWNRENEYNSPSAQMARYVEAGLNPTLAIGGSSVAASSPQFEAVQTDAVGVPSYTPYRENSVMGNSLNSLASGLEDLETYDTKQSLLENALESSNLDNKGKELDNKGKELDNGAKEAGKPYWSVDAGYRSQTLGEQLKKLQSDIRLSEKQYDKMVLECQNLNQMMQLRDGETKRISELHDMTIKERALAYKRALLDYTYEDALQSYRMELLPKIKDDAERDKLLAEYELKLIRTRSEVESRLDNMEFLGISLGDLVKTIGGWIVQLNGQSKYDGKKRVIKH